MSVTPIELTMNDDSYSRYDLWQTYQVFKLDPMQDSIVNKISPYKPNYSIQLHCRFPYLTTSKG